MIPYNNPEEQLDHEEYIDELENYINVAAGMTGPLHLFSIPKVLRARRAYYRDAFLATDIYAFMAQCAYSNIIWALCEYKILIYSRLVWQERSLKFKLIPRKRKLAQIQAEKRELTEAFFDLTGEDISTYIYPFQTIGSI